MHVNKRQRKPKIENGQSRDTGNIGCTRHITKKEKVKDNTKKLKR